MRTDGAKVFWQLREFDDSLANSSSNTRPRFERYHRIVLADLSIPETHLRPAHESNMRDLVQQRTAGAAQQVKRKYDITTDRASVSTVALIALLAYSCTINNKAKAAERNLLTLLHVAFRNASMQVNVSLDPHCKIAIDDDLLDLGSRHWMATFFYSDNILSWFAHGNAARHVCVLEVMQSGSVLQEHVRLHFHVVFPWSLVEGRRDSNFGPTPPFAKAFSRSVRCLSTSHFVPEGHFALCLHFILCPQLAQ